MTFSTHPPFASSSATSQPSLNTDLRQSCALPDTVEASNVLPASRPLRFQFHAEAVSTPRLWCPAPVRDLATGYMNEMVSHGTAGIDSHDQNTVTPLKAIGSHDLYTDTPTTGEMASSSITTVERHKSLTANSTTSDMTLQSRMWALEHWVSRKIEGLQKEMTQLKLCLQSAEHMPLTPTSIVEEYDNKTNRVTGSNFGPDGEDGTITAREEPTWSFRSLEGGAGTTKASNFIPLAIRVMPELNAGPLAQQPLPLAKLKSFPHSLLTTLLGGSEYGAGMYYPATRPMSHSKQLAGMVKRQTYYLLDTSVDPFAPTQPGAHGAKLVVVMRALEDDKMVMKVPLFVCLNRDEHCGSAKAGNSKDPSYIYMGHYSQTRWSDRLDVDRAEEIVPEHVKHHWAKKLASKDRPEWMTDGLMVALCPKPEYDGALPDNKSGGEGAGASEGPNEKADVKAQLMKRDVQAYVEDLKEWEGEARAIANRITKQGILEAFKRADGAGMPGLRFWWEYLECVGFDRNFYYMLVTAMERRGE